MKKLFILLISLALSNLGYAQSKLDSLDLLYFMDGVVETHLRNKHIAGATLCVVKDGKIILAKGYGFSDVKKQTPVLANETLFRIGSISKLFTWTSVMQLVQQGKLDLNADINQYLKDFKIPDTYKEPITLKHLMTHSPGFEDLVIGLFAKDASKVKRLGEILAIEMPGRVRPPGEVASYSNHGTGIAAYIVEQVSGMNWMDYVEKNILNPLAMTSTTFRQPVPNRLISDLSKGYVYLNGEFKEKPFEYVPLAPVGAASTTAVDMANFMLAHLQLGSFEGVHILDSATAKLMQSPAFQHSPNVNPMRYGFMDMSQNGEEVIGHGGDTFWFHSNMALLPKHKVGLFISFNSEKGGGTYSEVLEAFMDRYFPEKNPLKPSIVLSSDYLKKFAGEYRVNRFAYNDLTKVASWFGRAQISIVESSKLKTKFGENIDFWLPIDSLTFRNELTSEVIEFKKVEGKITTLFIGDLPILAFDKMSGIETSAVHTTILVVSIIFILSTLIGGPMKYFIRRDYKREINSARKVPLSARLTSWCTSLWFLVFFILLAVGLGDPNAIVYGVPLIVKIALAFPLVAAFFTVFVWYFVIMIWMNRSGDTMDRLSYTFFGVVCLLQLWQLNYWNLLGYYY
ncbi:MAG: beta-lactamase family protein [Bacteroidia bacterium]|nr:beta-lactamase family protein [Bacteroidia bacterium]